MARRSTPNSSHNTRIRLRRRGRTIQQGPALISTTLFLPPQPRHFNPQLRPLLQNGFDVQNPLLGTSPRPHLRRLRLRRYPGVILASYISGTPARSTAALTDEEHVALIQRTIIQVHGSIAAEQFTGIYERQCWEVDRHQAGAWADPLASQQELYLSAYYQTEFRTVFIGEHTSCTHAWIFSALDSVMRRTVQLLLDLGLINEAKMVVQRWITV